MNYQHHHHPYPVGPVRVAFVRDRRGPCSWLGNILWLVLGGWHLFLSWFTVGILLSITLVFCPCGVQAIKIACFLLCPFGKTLVSSEDAPCGCVCNCLLNVIWIYKVGWMLALQALATGVALCLTIVGIPFGVQCFKLAYISLWPFGLELSSDVEETVTISTTRYTIFDEGTNKERDRVVAIRAGDAI
jgi:uncharacterized membrane protein YccF (DUF307 family)